MSPADMAEYAVRYCMTRWSYAFTDGLDIANQYWESLSSATRSDVVSACVDRRVDDWRRWPALRADVEERRSWDTNTGGLTHEWESYWISLSLEGRAAQQRMMDDHHD